MTDPNPQNKTPSRGFATIEPRLSFVFLVLFSLCLTARMIAGLFDEQTKNQPPPLPPNTTAIVQLNSSELTGIASSTLSEFPEASTCLKTALNQFNLQDQDLWRLAGIKKAILVKNRDNTAPEFSLFWTADKPDEIEVGLIRWFLAQCLPGQTKTTLPAGERIDEQRTDKTPVSYQTDDQTGITVISFEEHHLFYKKQGDWHILSSTPNFLGSPEAKNYYCHTTGVRPGLFASFPPFFRNCDQLPGN